MLYIKVFISSFFFYLMTQTLWAKSIPSPKNLKIPKRGQNSITGSKLIEALLCEPIYKRESMIMSQLKKGNIPDFLRQLKPVLIPYKDPKAKKQMYLTIYVMPDYLSVGTDDDFVRIPLNLSSALELTNSWNFILPTPKMVDLIYANADCKIPPHPLKPGPAMASPAYVKDHNLKVDLDTPDSASKKSLKAGHKKDIVLSNRLLEKKNRIAIYGWHRLTGKPIQPLSTVHRSDYADYSHGVRLVYNQVWLNKSWVPITQILSSKKLSFTLSHEGPIKIIQPSQNCN